MSSKNNLHLMSPPPHELSAATVFIVAPVKESNMASINDSSSPKLPGNPKLTELRRNRRRIEKEYEALKDESKRAADGPLSSKGVIAMDGRAHTGNPSVAADAQAQTEVSVDSEVGTANTVPSSSPSEGRFHEAIYDEACLNGISAAKILLKKLTLDQLEDISVGRRKAIRTSVGQRQRGTGGKAAEIAYTEGVNAAAAKLAIRESERADE